MIQQSTLVSKMYSELCSGWNFWFCEIRESVRLSWCSKKVFTRHYKTYKGFRNIVATPFFLSFFLSKALHVNRVIFFLSFFFFFYKDITISLGQLISVILSNIFFDGNFFIKLSTVLCKCCFVYSDMHKYAYVQYMHAYLN